MNYAFLKDTVRRWRHNRGYGVHSPLAYRIVKDCIRPDKRYGFYSDAYIDFEYIEDRKALKNARLALRLVNLLRPKRIWMPGGDKRLYTALKMSFPSTAIAMQKEYPKNTDFIICSSGDSRKMWEKMDEMKECAMIVFGKEIEKIEGATLVMTSKNFTIILRREGMDFVSYMI